MPLSRRLSDLLGTELPLIQAPMAGAQGSALAIAVSEAGGLGSLPCAMLSPDQIRQELNLFRQATGRPINVNFFTHKPPNFDPAREAAWKARLAPYYRELGLDLDGTYPVVMRQPFSDETCRLVEQYKPEVVSFHFGLPEPALLDRVRRIGARILSSATTAAEARWLEAHGCDAIIAQGYEAGGHRGIFLGDAIGSQPGTLALVPQIVDAVKVPVIAAGGIADGRGVAAAVALGADGVQVGTAYLKTPEASISALHREALRTASDDATALTNVFTGRPARGLVNRLMRETGPLSAEAPAFPLASTAVAPLRAKAEAAGSSDFTSLWSGQAAALARARPAAELTRALIADAKAVLARHVG